MPPSGTRLIYWRKPLLSQRALRRVRVPIRQNQRFGGTRNRTYQLCIRNIDVFYIAALNCYTICYTIGRGFLAGVPQFDAETGIDQDEVGGRFYCPNAACPGRYRVLSGQTAFWGLNRSVANDPSRHSASSPVQAEFAVYRKIFELNSDFDRFQTGTCKRCVSS